MLLTLNVEQRQWLTSKTHFRTLAQEMLSAFLRACDVLCNCERQCVDMRSFSLQRFESTGPRPCHAQSFHLR